MPEAESSLRFAAEQDESASLKAIAQLRLARLVLGRGDAQKALDAVNAMSAESYVAEREQVRGDALLALGRGDEARKAYDAALAVMDVAAQQRRSLQAKRDDVAAGGPVVTAPAVPATPAPDTKEPAAPVVATPVPAEQG